MKKLAIILCSVLLCTAYSEAYDFIQGQGTGLGNALLLSHSTPTMLLAAPSGGLIKGEWRVETGYNRQFELSELDQFFAAGAWRWRNLSSAFGFSQFGQGDRYAEKTAKLALGWQNRLVSFGLSGSLLMASFGGAYGNLSAGSFGLGGAVRRAPFYAAFSADNLTSPRLSPGSPKLKPTYNGYLEFANSRSLSTVGRLRAQGDERLQVALGQRIGLGRSGALLWGFSTAPVQFGGGLDLRIKGSAISYTVSYHPVLGLSHTIAVTYGSRIVEAGADEFK